MLRRIIWNLIRVEYEHTKNCGKLNAVPDLNYNKIIKDLPTRQSPITSSNKIFISDQENAT